ncbi:MAG: DUF4331 domain-containing protein, partial [Anaerolineae bacterium]|nr:DUF4331 domain-containing protein [Anaerolineae bacterium]
IPGELPQGGPNYYQFDDSVYYTLNVDNNGDAVPDWQYELKCRSSIANGETFLYNVGPMQTFNDPNRNSNQVCDMHEINDNQVVMFKSDIPVAPVNIGTKSTPRYERLWESTITTIPLPSDNNGNDSNDDSNGDDSIEGAANTNDKDKGKGKDKNVIKVFAGPSDDPFWVDLGSIFDLLTLRGQPVPIGYEYGRKVPTDGLNRFNVHTFAVQVPIARLLKDASEGETVIGVWATSHRSSTRVLSFGAESHSGELVQVSRLGMPLVNEVVLPLALKDAFNGLEPKNDFGLFTNGTPAGNLLARSVLTPELQTLLGALYGVPNPGKPRTDLLNIFLTGMTTAQPFTIQTKNGPVTLPAGFNVNTPKNVQPAEMIRLNTAIKGDLCKPQPDYQLGLLGGDACGFPNGRRLADDVTDIELLAVAGAAWQPLTGDTSFTFNPALVGVLNDGLPNNDKPFRNEFPYVAVPHQGQAWR